MQQRIDRFRLASCRSTFQTVRHPTRDGAASSRFFVHNRENATTTVKKEETDVRSMMIDAAMLIKR
jgi:hypothetical protein